MFKMYMLTANKQIYINNSLSASVYLCIRLSSNSSNTAGHIITILGEFVVLIPGMVLIHFLKVTYPWVHPRGYLTPWVLRVAESRNLMYIQC